MHNTHPEVVMIEAHGLGYERRDERIFGPLDFRIDVGTIGLIEGDNGSGKTTLLRVLSGMLRPSFGHVSVFGADPGSEEARSSTAALGHLLGLKGDLTVLENLRVGTGLYGQREGSDALATLARVGLEGYAEEPVRSLSAGQKKRTALARLALLPAKLWLLDEPYANLDRHGIALVNDLLATHAASGGTALVTSHGAVNFHQGVACTIRLAA